MPPSVMAIVRPPRVLVRTTRMRYAPAGPTRNRPGSSSSRASASAGRVDQVASSVAMPAPRRRQVERRLVVGVGDAQAATRIEQPESQAVSLGDVLRLRREPANALQEPVRIAHVRGTERMQAQQLVRRTRATDGARQRQPVDRLVQLVAQQAELGGAAGADDGRALAPRLASSAGAAAPGPGADQPAAPARAARRAPPATRW